MLHIYTALPGGAFVKEEKKVWTSLVQTNYFKAELTTCRLLHTDIRRHNGSVGQMGVPVHPALIGGASACAPAAYSVTVPV